MTCAELGRAFKESKHEDDALKIGMVYFADGVLIEARSNVPVNLNYFHLVKDVEMFNDYSWGGISFEQL